MVVSQIFCTFIDDVQTATEMIDMTADYKVFLFSTEYRVLLVTYRAHMVLAGK